MTFKNLSHKGLKRTFVVDLVNGSSTNLAQIENGYSIKITKQSGVEDLQNGLRPVLEVVDIAGIDQALKKLNRFLKNFSWKFHLPSGQRSCGVLLHGGHGTGKTFIVERLVKTGWGKVLTIESDLKVPEMREIFRKAKANQPSIIVMDELESIVSKDGVAKLLGQELDNLVANHPRDSMPQVLVVAATYDISTIPMSLKKLRRFQTNIALPIPDAAARKAILKSLDVALRPEERDEILDRLGDRTHAYTPEDLATLLSVACDIGEERYQKSNILPVEDEYFITQDDIEQAMLVVRPTAMHDITLQPPSVKWDEIGGQDNVKKALRRAVETPLLVSSTFHSFIKTMSLI